MTLFVHSLAFAIALKKYNNIVIIVEDKTKHYKAASKKSQLSI